MGGRLESHDYMAQARPVVLVSSRLGINAKGESLKPSIFNYVENVRQL
jgi:hypothetical protein